MPDAKLTNQLLVLHTCMCEGSKDHNPAQTSVTMTCRQSTGLQLAHLGVKVVPDFGLKLQSTTVPDGFIPGRLFDVTTSGLLASYHSTWQASSIMLIDSSNGCLRGAAMQL